MNSQGTAQTAGKGRDPIDVGSGGELTVVVFAPRKPDPQKFTWLKSMLVGKAADEAAQAFGYEAGTPTLQEKKDGRVLDRQKTLAAAGVQDTDELELTDSGGGV